MNYILISERLDKIIGMFSDLRMALDLQNKYYALGIMTALYKVDPVAGCVA